MSTASLTSSVVQGWSSLSAVQLCALPRRTTPHYLYTVFSSGGCQFNFRPHRWTIHISWFCNSSTRATKVNTSCLSILPVIMACDTFDLDIIGAFSVAACVSLATPASTLLKYPDPRLRHTASYLPIRILFSHLGTCYSFQYWAAAGGRNCRGLREICHKGREGRWSICSDVDAHWNRPDCGCSRTWALAS